MSSDRSSGPFIEHVTMAVHVTQLEEPAKAGRVRALALQEGVTLLFSAVQKTSHLACYDELTVAVIICSVRLVENF